MQVHRARKVDRNLFRGVRTTESGDQVYDLKQVLGSSRSVKQVVNVVQSIVESGGNSQAIDAMPVSILGSVLMVRTTERNHVEIEQLLSILAESFGQSN